MKILRSVVAALIAILVIISFGCGTNRRDERLNAINAMASRNPGLAISMLDSIDVGSLDDYNRHFYDFLAIKTADKAYVTHRSDSLYRKVEGYFSKHKDDLLYPEVLYYGGRVYSDLGDYPRALKFFQSALELIPKDEENLQLRLNAISQTGRLLDKMRLHEQAIPYLTECVKSDKIIKDTVNLSYDLQLLASCYMHQKLYLKAQNLIKEALDLVDKNDSSTLLLLEAQLMAIKYLENDNDSALTIARNLVKRNNDIETRDFVITYAAEIYEKAGIHDTAILYARDLLESKKLSWQITGYNILISNYDKLGLNPNQMKKLIKDYITIIENHYNLQDHESVMFQNAFYNYSTYQRRNNELVQSRYHLLISLMVSLIIILVLGSVIINYRVNNKKKASELKIALYTIADLNRSIRDKGIQLKDKQSFINVDETMSSKDVEDNSESGKTKNTNHQTDKQLLMKNLENEILQLKKSADKMLNNAEKDYAIRYDVNLEIDRMLQNGVIVSPGSELWQRALEEIREFYPEFETRIERLSKNRLNEQEFHVVILLKLGFNYSQSAKIIGRVKSAVSYINKKICRIMFYDLVSPDDLQDVIRVM